MSITFKLRDGEVTIPKKELEVCMFGDWYISKLVCNSIDTKENDTFEVWEDEDVFMTIINSMRLNNLILYDDDINFDYLYALADKYCVNEKILEQIKEKKKIHEYNQKTIVEKYLNNYIQLCSNCNCGFSLKENKSDSCRYHVCMYNSVMNNFQCCGHTFDHENPDNPLNRGCKVGYHVHKINVNIFKQMQEID
jgi:hypothetical protein